MLQVKIKSIFLLLPQLETPSGGSAFKKKKKVQFFFFCSQCPNSSNITVQLVAADATLQSPESLLLFVSLCFQKQFAWMDVPAATPCLMKVKKERKWEV